MSQEIDYAAVLADLERRKAALEAAIAGIEQIMGQSGTDGLLQITKSPSSLQMEEHQEVAPGIFHGLSISEAAKKYLNITKTKQKTRSICDAIRKGGIETVAKNFYSNVYSILQRDKQFVRLGKYWALAAWYPSRAATSPSKPRKRTRSKKSKPIMAKGPAKPEMASSELKVAG